ncbi:MAG: molybdopterin biosynthesis protein [Clostridiales bacterium]|jgi:putative molybdopterin biosynthesis protein|nr:molybdopterin biosynthesis protein [Eubacteriales bacterium]MDH7566472.1 molybdopterin biosynthesis protein [Clostridiales bacterium]
MGYSYLNNMEMEEALELYLNEIKARGIHLDTEEVPVQEAVDRVTSRAVFARISSPHYNACAMDGIALFSKSTSGATDTTPVFLKENEDFVRVDTGDPLPDRFDAVVMIEDVIEVGDGRIKLIAAASPWQHVRQIGEDICAEEMLLPSNTRIEPAAVGALLAGGVLKVEVKKRPVVGIIPTGDEIVSPTDSPGAGEIIEFNGSIFSGIVRRWGAVPRVYGIVPDEFELIKNAVVEASKECDVVLLNAGSSAGREDYSARAISEAGDMLVHGISIKPGKPTILGIVNNRPVIGVPGYPVSGIIVIEMMVKRIMEYLMGLSCEEEKTASAVLVRKVVSSLKYKEYVRVKLGEVGGRLVATPLDRGAGVVTSFVKADGLMEIPLNSEGYEKGREVRVKLLKSMDEIRNSLVIVGSHDPLVDVVGDIMRRNYPGEYVSSAHVGSMGGIMAVKRGEAHAAGIHLLDEETGEYNTSYARRYLGNENICLIKCVKRVQGFMTAPGNPKQIKSVSDLSREGVRYVNRQKGSGTRILLDYMLKGEGIDPEGIYGYEREEFTHLSVAALVAAGSADVGLGIYSAARAYGLDFIPVCEEQYDFIVPEKFMELKMVRHLREILESREFKERLDEMGGYRF